MCQLKYSVRFAVPKREEREIWTEIKMKWRERERESKTHTKIEIYVKKMKERKMR